MKKKKQKREVVLLSQTFGYPLRLVSPTGTYPDPLGTVGITSCDVGLTSLVRPVVPTVLHYHDRPCPTVSDSPHSLRGHTIPPEYVPGPRTYSTPSVDRTTVTGSPRSSRRHIIHCHHRTIPHNLWIYPRGEVLLLSCPAVPTISGPAHFYITSSDRVLQFRTWPFSHKRVPDPSTPYVSPKLSSN